MQANQISCPRCHTLIDISGREGDQNCPACNYHYAIHDGIIDFAPDDHFYWGEVSQEAMEHVNQAALDKGWFNAFVENIVGSNQRDMAGYLLDPVRIAGLFHFYDPQHNEVCVDLGSGWGPIAFGLRKFYKTVYSMDGVYDRLRFQAIRAEQDGIDNVKIIKGSLLKLPLPDNSADTVIVNGLLEWIGLSDEVTPPRELQLAFLREVRRVLKPTGKLFIGIENRFGAQYVLGGRDHSGLRFTSLMPRWLAGRAVRHARRLETSSFFEGGRHDYRTPTYTYWGYARLLRQAGFLQPDIYWTWPSYNEPRVSGTLDGNSVGFYLGTVESEMKGLLRRTLLGLTRRMPRPVLGLMMKLFSPHFLILTGKDHQAGGLQQEALGNKFHRSSLLRTTLNTTKSLNTDYLLLNNKGMSRKINIEPLLNNSHPHFHLEEQKGASGWPVHIDSVKEVGFVGQWLGSFQQQNRQGQWSQAELEEDIHRLLESAWPSMDGLSAPLEHYASAFLAQTRSRSIPLVTEHGDFVPQNILIDHGDEVKVTGWNHTRPSGSPFMDAGAFLLSLGASGPIDEFAREYCRRVDLPLHLAPAYYILRVLARDFAAAPLNESTYLGYTYWKPRLQLALQQSEGLIVHTGR